MTTRRNAEGVFDRAKREVTQKIATDELTRTLEGLGWEIDRVSATRIEGTTKWMVEAEASRFGGVSRFSVVVEVRGRIAGEVRPVEETTPDPFHGVNTHNPLGVSELLARDND